MFPPPPFAHEDMWLARHHPDEAVPTAQALKTELRLVGVAITSGLSRQSITWFPSQLPS